MLFWPVLALAAACPQAPTGQEIAQALTARAAQDAVSVFGAKYRKEWFEEDLDDQGNSRRTKTKVWRLEGNGARFVQTTVSDSTGESKPGEREEKTADARRMFVARYNFHVEAPCIDASRVLVVSFTPRTDVELPNGEDEDQLLNHLSGTMYIDMDKWYVRRAYGRLDKPFRVKLIGKVTDARVWMEQDDEDGVVIVRAISTEIWAESRLWPLPKERYHFRQIYQFFREPSETTPSISPLP